MNKSLPVERWISRIALATLVVSLLFIFVCVVAETYVRWKLNSSFTFLGGGELETLVASTFLLLFGVLWIYRPKTERLQ